MLQQTQAGRVASKYRLFIERFPDVYALDGAELRDVLDVWHGLGYNRRALSLKKAASVIAGGYNGIVPGTVDELAALPGIGHNTAAAIMAYAFDLPVVYVETNIRTVFIHHFFPDTEIVADRDILPLVEQCLDREHPRKWYSALMDYGVMLKAKHNNPSRRSAHHTTQSAFEGSDRQIRGEIVGLLTSEGGMTARMLAQRLNRDSVRVKAMLDRLVAERLVALTGKRYRIGEG